MSQIEQKLHEIDQLNDLQQRDRWINQLHPLVKLVLSFGYIIFVVSIDKYDLTRMILMAIYLIALYTIADLSVRDAVDRMKLILPLVLAVGIFNPFLDRVPVLTIGTLTVTTGMISMVSLMLKGIYTVLAAYLLIATTSIEEICYALRILRVPKVMVTVILLTYRYIMIMGEEADRIMTAYQLRAPSQKGIHYKAWGPLVGQWMLRSFDRAEHIYEGMVLRGFRGEYVPGKEYHATRKGVCFAAGCLLALALLRLWPM